MKQNIQAILNLNVRNFKTNHVYTKEAFINNSIDIMFLSELWLHEGEEEYLQHIFPNTNIYFQSDISVESKYSKRGRPFGGKAWIIRNEIIIMKQKWVNEEISYVVISNEKNIAMYIIIGVYLRHDNNTTVRMCEYTSNLQIINVILQDYANLPTFIVGDFNADVERNKRFDNLLRDFIASNELNCAEYVFYNSNYTYKNGDYTSNIDHVITNRLAKQKTLNCQILQNDLNMSDHNALLTSFLIGNNETNNKTISKTKFHRFRWDDEDFKERYKSNLSRNLATYKDEIKENASTEQKNEMICENLQQLNKILIKSARQAEIKKKTSYTYKQIKEAWTTELKDLSMQMIFGIKHGVKVAKSAILQDQTGYFTRKNSEFYRKAIYKVKILRVKSI